MTLAAPRRPPDAAALPGGSAAKAPAAWVPGLHFAAALLYLVLGSAALVLVAPELSAGAYLAPRVAGTTHLFTLGWITTSIMGALYQFLPVALDRPIRSERIAYVTLALYAPGLLAFVLGLATVQRPLMLGGAALFGSGLLLFIGNLTATLKSATRRDVTWWALSFATFYLGVTLVLGLALTGNLRWGYLGAGRLNALGVHLHVALSGWVLLVMIGVAHRLLPMFLLSHGAGDRFAKAAVALVAAGAGVLTFLHHAPPLFGRWLPSLLIAAGTASFLLQARKYYATRHRPALDPGMRLAAGGLALLALAMLLAAPVVLSVATARLSVAYVGTAILGISLFVAAHHYKIVPFLVWYHRFGPVAGRQTVPRVSELFSARLAVVAATALFAGAVGTIIGVTAGLTPVTRAAAIALLSGALLMSAQMFQLWRTRP